VSISKRV